MPFEASLAKELQDKGLKSARMATETRERIGQTSSAVALSGLRTFVATFLHLRAFTYFQEQRWDDVANTFDTIVDLAPRTDYYWETGSWHSAFNAASYYINSSEMPSLRRREAWRASILRGRAFLERGIRNNPDHWSLHANLAFLLSQPEKLPAFRDQNEVFLAAANAYRMASMGKKAPAHFKHKELFCLARIPGKEHEALLLGRKLSQERQHRVPTLLALMVALEYREDSSSDPLKCSLETHKTPQQAYDNLCNYWRRTGEKFPINGIAQALAGLEKMLAIPEEKSVFKKPLPPPGGPDSWFEGR